MTSKVPNQLDVRLLGVNGLNSWDGSDSASRKQMLSSQIGQHLVFSGMTERRHQTGMEQEYGKYTFSTKMPHDGEVIRTIDLYRKSYDYESIELNPLTAVIFERTDTREVGVVMLQNYFSQHPYFGFDYKRRPAMSKLRPGNLIKKGEIFLDSPGVTNEGGYMFGAECRVAFMSHPAVSEDGILISDEATHKFRIKTYERRVVEWGNKRFALNLYGDEKHYRPFPDIGDYVREDGVLMALREYDDELGIVEQNIHSLREIDYIFDRATYVPSSSRGRVVDIRVHHDPNAPASGAPIGMDEQGLKYNRKRRDFYQAIFDEYNRLKRERGAGLRLSPEFNRLVVEAISVIGRNTTAPNEPIRKLYRQAPLDQWRVEFVIEYEIQPSSGFKLSDCHGGKGVICRIEKAENMPTDANGNRAEIVMDPNSTISRMNIGRIHEQYMGAAEEQIEKYLVKVLGLEGVHGAKETQHKLSIVEVDNPALFEHAWDYLMGYYRIVSPQQYGWFATGAYTKTRVEHLTEVVTKGIYIYLPPNNEPEFMEIVEGILKHYPPHIGPVTYVGTSGKRRVTKEDILIGRMYVIMLEKIADDWTAVSSGKLQHFGVLSQVSGVDKYAHPSRNQAIRAWGEAEVRIGVSYVGGDTMADILDRNNNPITHKHILRSILSADKPTAIMEIVDRKEIPLGGSKPHQLIRHVMKCCGMKFVYKPDGVTQPW